MTVANGREFLSIPGPTNIPDAVLQAMHRPAIDIYSGDMVDLTRTLLEDLPRLFRTSGRVFIYAANGHGGWEAAVSNVLSSPMANNGQFSFNYTANPGLTYVVQGTPDFVSWSLGNTNVAASNPVTFSESIGANSFRFYRVLRLPNP